MIKFENLAYSFPQKELYNDITFTIEPNQHCAFIGSNGTGKSTLAHMIMEPDSYLFDGKLEKEASSRIGFISQFSTQEESSKTTVFEYLSQEFATIQETIDTLCNQMGDSDRLEELLELYQFELDKFQAIDGENHESNIRKQLQLAGMDKQERLPISKLSGGEFKLVQVMKEMLIMPDLLIMDEPDAFLDFTHLNALQDLINNYKGALLVITHNRYLLNHCFQKILHLENRELQEFEGSYIEYNFALLQKKVELQEMAVADEEEIERNKLLVDKLRTAALKFSDASRGRALRARVSLVERLEARKIKEPFVEIREPEIKFDLPQEITEESLHQNEVVLKIQNYSITFAEELLQDICLEIQRGDKVALIGGNGTGKTTILHDVFTNKNQAIEIGEKVEFGFLSQNQGERLTEANTILEEFFELGFETKHNIEEYLMQYHFDPEQLESKIEVLSGGEKNLLQLAKISYQKPNFLLLDEPTSHLDTYAQLALEKALVNFKGTVLMVSHDFYTIANCMDYVLLIENKKIRKMSIRKFRQMIYANHFDKDYLEREQKKKELEIRIEKALKERKFEDAQVLCVELEEVIKSLL